MTSSGPGAVKLRDVIAGRAATNPAQFALPDDDVTDGNSVQATLTMASARTTAAATSRRTLPTRTTSKSCSGIATTPRAHCPPNNADDVIRLRRLRHIHARHVHDFLPAAQGGYQLHVDSATGNTFRPFSSAIDQYNFGPLNHYLRPDTRYSLGAMGHYELAEFADVYTQLMFTDVRSVAQIAPGGIFFDTSTINCDNPFLSAQRRHAGGAPTTMAARSAARRR